MSDELVEQSKESTLEPKIVITPAMKVWLDTAIETQSDSPTEIAEKSGLDKSSWYKWLKLPGFEDWYYENYKKQRRRWLPTLDKMGLKNAAKDYNYWKDMRKAAGEDVESKGTTINLNNLIKIE
jgi:hypothetical protein